MTGTPELMFQVLFQAAQDYWPNLTRKEFGEVSLAVMKENEGSLSMAKMSLLLYEELTKRFGPSPATRPE